MEVIWKILMLIMLKIGSVVLGKHWDWNCLLDTENALVLIPD